MQEPSNELPCQMTPSPDWRADMFLVFDAVNDGPYMAQVECRFAEGARAMRVRVGLFPGLLTRVVVPLACLDGERSSLPRTPHGFTRYCLGGPVDPARLTEVSLEGRTPGGRAAVRISPPRLTDGPPSEWPRAERPIVDELHQWAERDWPGKAASLDGIRALVTEEFLATQMGTRDELDRWGGWTGRRSFEATGFFRAERDDERWWLATPDGRPFYSVGVNAVSPHGPTQTRGNEDLFTDLPPKDGELRHCWAEGEGGERTVLNAIRYNLVRALGEPWFEGWAELSVRRLEAWGFNTLGAWSDPRICRVAGMPYVWQLRDFPTTSATIWRDFPDVFCDEFARNSRRFAEQLEDLREDRHMIGYFLRCEPEWALGPHVLAERMLSKGGRSDSRDRMVEWLRERYGQIAALNVAWETEFAEFAALAGGALRAEQMASEAAREDLAAFSRLMVERYVQVPAGQCRRVDAHHLNFGVRYHWWPGRDELAAGVGEGGADVLTVSCFEQEPGAEWIAQTSRRTGRPVLIGGFHSGALDRGLPGGGLRVVWTQEDRAESYRYYVERAAAMPAVVGTHYAQWNDMHVAGAPGGANYQVGFVDICQLPYARLASAARLSHARIYKVAAGQVRPYEQPAESIPIA